VLKEPRGQQAQLLVPQVLKDYKEAKDHKVLLDLQVSKVTQFQVHKETTAHKEIKGLPVRKVYKE
jgi:hypothetical protein